MVKALKSEFKAENPLGTHRHFYFTYFALYIYFLFFPEKRRTLSEKMRRQFPNHIPIIVEKGQANAPDIKKKKFLVPEDNSMKKLVIEIRKHIPELKQDEAIFVFIGDVVPQMGK